jgi:hypothetical protein
MELTYLQKMGEDKPQRWLNITLYCIVYVLLFPFYKSGVSADTIAYIDIANKYASGNIHFAINSYWSPMLSWLLVPFIWLKINPLWGIHAIKFFASLFSIIIFQKINAHLFSTNKLLKNFSLFLFSCYAVYYALYFPGADNFSVLLLLVYLLFVLRNDIFIRPFATACLAAILFFTKSFCFYFFLAHFISSFFFMLFAKQMSRTLLFNTLKTLITFLLISFVWLIALHNKYDKWQISSAGAYNHSIAAVPEPYHRSHNTGLLPPPDSLSTSAWTDITAVYQAENWSAFDGAFAMKRQFNIWQNNTWFVLKFLYGMNKLAWLVLIAAMFLIWRNRKTENVWLSHRTKILFFGALYAAGYILLVVEDRYLWILPPLVLLLSIDLLAQFNFIFAKNKWLKLGSIALLMLGIMYGVAQRIWFYRMDKEMIVQAEKATQLDYIFRNSRIAEYKSYQFNYTAYLINCQDYGGIAGYKDENTIEGELQKNGINYLLLPDSVFKVKNYWFIRNYKDSVFGDLHVIKLR